MQPDPEHITYVKGGGIVQTTEKGPETHDLTSEFLHRATRQDYIRSVMFIEKSNPAEN